MLDILQIPENVNILKFLKILEIFEIPKIFCNFRKIQKFDGLEILKL